jgi:uncharacterized membrane protein
MSDPPPEGPSPEPDALGGSLRPARERRETVTSDTARLETFSDGVLAIAITLLILEVRPPDVPPDGSLVRALYEEWPSYLAYVTSFLTLGIIWANHHRMFKLIDRSTNGFLMLNVLFLMVISFIPFPTALVADYIRAPRPQQTTAVVVYGGTMVLTAIMFNVVWRFASSGHRLLVPGLDPQTIRRRTRGYTAGPIVYGVATLIAFVDPEVSMFLFVAMAIFYTLPISGPG